MQRMIAAMAHRGPDSRGVWNNETSNGGVGLQLGHTRLAIIDLREISNQPLLDTATGNVLVYNGEIYNFREIAATLSDAGVQFKTNSDTEVLLQAYNYWGTECLHHFRGMFAFALWDQQRRTVLLARDRLGIKPLYVAQDTDQKILAFASEVRSLLASGVVDRRLSPQALESYLWHGFVCGRQSIIKNVESLLPGSFQIIDEHGNRLEEKRYWVAPQSIDDGENVVSIEEARDELEQAIRLRLISDVPLGVFLSGGTDSSVVAANASRMGNEQIQTFTTGFDVGGFDESVPAAEFAASIGAQHTCHRIGEEQFCAILPDALAAMDQPTCDGINSFLISHQVRSADIVVALSGTGGDELFGGYESFRALAKARKLSLFGSFLPDSQTGRSGRVLRHAFLSRDRKLRLFLDHAKKFDLIDCGDNLVDAYQVQYSVFSRTTIDQLLQTENNTLTSGLAPIDYKRLQDETRDASVPSAIGHLELYSFLSERILRDADSASMAVSLELRVPLIDHKWIETLAAIPSNQRYQPIGKKTLLREIGLTSEQRRLVERPKAGFTIPIKKWLGGATGGLVATTLQDQELARQTGLDPTFLTRLLEFNTPENSALVWPRLWSLFVLMKWCRQHSVSIN